MKGHEYFIFIVGVFGVHDGIYIIVEHLNETGSVVVDKTHNGAHHSVVGVLCVEFTVYEGDDVVGALLYFLLDLVKCTELDGSFLV